MTIPALILIALFTWSIYQLITQRRLYANIYKYLILTAVEVYLLYLCGFWAAWTWRQTYVFVMLIIGALNVIKKHDEYIDNENCIFAVLWSIFNIWVFASAGVFN